MALAKAQESIEIPDNRFTASPLNRFQGGTRFASLTLGVALFYGLLRRQTGARSQCRIAITMNGRLAVWTKAISGLAETFPPSLSDPVELRRPDPSSPADFDECLPSMHEAHATSCVAPILTDWRSAWTRQDAKRARAAKYQLPNLKRVPRCSASNALIQHARKHLPSRKEMRVVVNGELSERHLRDRNDLGTGVTACRGVNV